MDFGWEHKKALRRRHLFPWTPRTALPSPRDPSNPPWLAQPVCAVLAVVIDGWTGEVESQLKVLSGAQSITLKAAPYLERSAGSLLTSSDGLGLMLGGRSFPYRSYPHVTGHVASAYCTRPFAKAGQPAFCLVWDGAMPARLYHVGGREGRLLDCLVPMIGRAYIAAGQRFGPYKTANRGWMELGIAGKVMAYIALGCVDENIVTVFQQLYDERFAAEFARCYHPDFKHEVGACSCA